MTSVAFGEARTHLGLAADQRNVNTELTSGADRALYDLAGGVVAAHGVNDDPHSCKISLSFSMVSMIPNERSEIAAFLLRFPFTR